MKIMTIIESSKGSVADKLCEYSDVSSNMAGRILNNIGDYSGFCDFINKVHSPEYTHGRIRRGLLHILLEIDNEIYNYKEQADYIRILGFKKEAAGVLALVKDRSTVPIVSKLSDAKLILNEKQLSVLKKDVHASTLYEYINASKSGRRMVSEYARQNQII